MQELKLWKFILEHLEQNQSVTFLCVLESKGSSPGRQGFKMAVTNNEMVGSIGGGIMEHKFVELAKEKLTESISESLIKKQFHNKVADKNQSGMICSGEQTIFLQQVRQDEIETIEKIINSLEQNQNGTLKITASGISFSVTTVQENDFDFEVKSENDFVYYEKTGYKNHLYIIGGGHCALALSKLMSSMDFYINLYEERKNLNTFSKNKFAKECVEVDDYSSLKDLIVSGKSTYVVIMTFGYRTDDIALRALIDKEFKYLGVLGSKTKIEKMFNELHTEGITEEQLKKIHAPIGIDIKSETPEEIAISIAAEIIKVKNSY
ncbi:MAG: XdhC family protein [Bacteroidia bacterium]